MDDDHEMNQDADTALDETDHDQVFSPINDEQRLDGMNEREMLLMSADP